MQPQKRRILCVDDDEDTCSMLDSLLKQENYEVRTAKSVSEALSVLLDRQRLDAVQDRIVPLEDLFELTHVREWFGR